MDKPKRKKMEKAQAELIITQKQRNSETAKAEKAEAKLREVADELERVATSLAPLELIASGQIQEGYLAKKIRTRRALLKKLSKKLRDVE